MPTPSSRKSVRVLADLTVTGAQGDIRIDNDSDGNLVVSFPNQKSFFSLLSAKLPVKSSWNTVVEANRTFYQNNQPLVVKVDDRPWITLGKFPRPRINYQRVTYPFISNTPSLKTGLYILAAAVGATLLYTIFRRRN
ncbi:hypothetical protein [Tunicatimonas pelagia]|uniref:hypothetical protein n=1 Tax=Tunicatimonas pelagia TaxID=931531 RepID=UPI00266689C1|nr:hypothetical protein [Tunicatimonas pelagia]WKN42550.1 hypothetical protein P0M28_26290 [Tunicatimonas pelagia]